ncbi:unnamed protein product [Acanthosepion pharaonis]|uniref:Uncharacterized protein n=1 Tax=Acanthosepion pharaonis TaxID=158019 RepID=A0A812BYQ9_ACAPH|nr:unnamed protein product [Sepia pharaonis]
MPTPMLSIFKRRLFSVFLFFFFPFFLSLFHSFFFFLSLFLILFLSPFLYSLSFFHSFSLYSLFISLFLIHFPLIIFFLISKFFSLFIDNIPDCLKSPNFFLCSSSHASCLSRPFVLPPIHQICLPFFSPYIHSSFLLSFLVLIQLSYRSCNFQRNLPILPFLDYELVLSFPSGLEVSDYDLSPSTNQCKAEGSRDTTALLWDWPIKCRFMHG